MEEELQNKIEELSRTVEEQAQEIKDLGSVLLEVKELLHEHKHTLYDDTKRINFEVNSKGDKITFPGVGTQYEIYREVGDNGELRIDAVNDYANEAIKIGSVNKPTTLYMYGGDEGLLGANNNTNDSYLLIEPGKVGIFTDKGNDFYFRLPAGTADPSSTATGALAVVNGVLKIYNGSAWTVVGTQT